MNNRTGHIIGAPQPETNKYKRHIIVDNLNKVIHIQIMPRIDGQLKVSEYDAIMAGYGLQFVPDDLKEIIAKAVNDGFILQPMQCIGWANADFYALNIVEVRRQQNPLSVPVGHG